MYPFSELVLSNPFKRAQRALSQCLESGAGLHDAAFGLHGLLHAMQPEERTRLTRWLVWRGYAAQSNRHQALAVRVEKMQEMLVVGVRAVAPQPRSRPRGSTVVGAFARSA